MAERTARDIMSPDPVTVTPDTPVTEAAKLIVERDVGALPVLDGGKVVGMVTESDLILQDVRLEFPTYIHLLDGFIMYPPAVARFENELKKAAGARVSDVMTSEAITVHDSTPIADIATIMVDRDISRLPVLDDTDKLVGIVSKHDIVRAIAEEPL